MKLLQSPRIRLLLLVLLGLAVLFASQISWDTRYRTASGIPGSFAPFGDELRRADGSVDYRATLNRQMGEPIPPSENAAAVYLPLLCQKELAEPQLREAVLRTIGISESEFAAGKAFHLEWERLAKIQSTWQAFEAPWPTPGDQSYPEVAAWLDRWQPQLEQMRAATYMKWYLPLVNPDPELPLHTDAMPVAMQGRHFASILRGSAFRAAARGDFDSAVTELVTAFRFARQLRGSGTLQNLVSIQIKGLASQAATQLIQNYQLGEPQLQTLAAALADEDFSQLTAPRSLRGERYQVLDLLQVADRGRAFQKLDNFPSPLNRPLFWNSFGSFIDRGRALERINLRFDALSDLARANQLQGSALQAQLKLWAEGFAGDWLPSGTEWLTILFLPPVRGAKLGELMCDSFRPGSFIPNTLVRITQEQRLVQLTIAAERYRCRDGKYPESLELLVPEFLPELPLDLFAESGSFGYECVPGGFRVFAAPSRPRSLPSWPGLTFEIRVERNAPSPSKKN
jgi:hypothetical protein